MSRCGSCSQVVSVVKREDSITTSYPMSDRRSAKLTVISDGVWDGRTYVQTLFAKLNGLWLFLYYNL